MTASKNPGGRKRKGSLYWTKSGWRARTTIDMDGVAIRKAFDLETTSKAVARIKLQRLLNGDDAAPAATMADEAKRLERSAEAWKRIVERQGNDGLKTWKGKLSLLDRYAGPHLSHLSVDDVKPEHISETLTAARDAGLSKQTVVHLRNALSTVFDDLWRDGLIDENPVKRARMPKRLRHDSRPRVSPSDELFARFMSCTRVPEHVRLMALASRCFGGMRTSDLHAWDWTHIDTESFATAHVYRPKTDDLEDGPTELVEIVIPEELGGPLKAWWNRWGRVTKGPVFPRMAGKHAGERHGKRSYARDLRLGFWRAGAHLPLEGFEQAMARLPEAEARLRALSKKGEGREAYRAALQDLKRATEAAKALDAIQSDTPKTRCLDFHSLRRAYATALASTGLNVQQAMPLAGHKRSETHMRYVQLTQRGPLVQPAGALPRLSGRSGVSASPVAELGGRSELSIGDPNENRTRVTGVRGRCPNR